MRHISFMTAKHKAVELIFTIFKSSIEIKRLRAKGHRQFKEVK